MVWFSKYLAPDKVLFAWNVEFCFLFLNKKKKKKKEISPICHLLNLSPQNSYVMLFLFFFRCTRRARTSLVRSLREGLLHHPSPQCTQITIIWVRFVISVITTATPKIFCTKVSDKVAYANSADRDQTASEGAVWSGSALFAFPLIFFKKHPHKRQNSGLKCME